MIRYFAVPLVFLMLTNASAACDGELIRTKTDDGKIIALRVSEQEILSAPKWHIGNGEPPLSITQAHQLAITWAKEKYKRYDRVEVESVQLQGYNCSHLNDRWLYIFEFEPIIDGNRLFGSGNWAAVLMDGSVIGPVKE